MCVSVEAERKASRQEQSNRETEGADEMILVCSFRR